MSKTAADAVCNSRRKGFVVFGEPIAAGLGVDGNHQWHQCWRHASGSNCKKCFMLYFKVNFYRRVYVSNNPGENIWNSESVHTIN